MDDGLAVNPSAPMTFGWSHQSQWRRFMPNIGVPSGVQGQSPGRGSRGRSPEAVSFSVYSGPKIPCFATQKCVVGICVCVVGFLDRIQSL